ncbi:alpha-L-fucosidase [bacterium]|nr:MAG: alpha-L-fucosidase [bacterium]
MPSRRTLLQSAAGLAVGTMLPIKMDDLPQRPKPYRSDRPLHDLQRRFLDTRMGMFIHFNMATFQDREWGDPNGPVEAFNPTALDTDQWAAAAKSANMGYGCLTTKHHDGFPIWPTKTVKDHAGFDVVRSCVDSFRKAGLRVGLYYSILDLRHDVRHFNVTPAKIEMIKKQLTELLTQYGEIDFLIFDGWDAPWSRITYEEVPFDEIYALVKSLQPNCLVCDLNAASYPAAGLYYGDIKAFEQNAGQAVPGGNQLPALSCVTLTDGWFWKTGDENRPLKSVHQVVDEWLRPQNEIHCNLIVNAAPNREGRLAPNVVARLEEIGRAWSSPGPMPDFPSTSAVTTRNLATGRPCRAIASGDTFGPDQANDGEFRSSWYLPEGLKEGWIEIDLPKGASFNTLTLVEPVGKWRDYATSRIKSYRFLCSKNGQWVEIARGGKPHSVQVHELPRTKSGRLRMEIRAIADTPHIADIGVYNEPR